MIFFASLIQFWNKQTLKRVDELHEQALNTELEEKEREKYTSKKRKKVVLILVAQVVMLGCFFGGLFTIVKYGKGGWDLISGYI